MKTKIPDNTDPFTKFKGRSLSSEVKQEGPLSLDPFARFGGKSHKPIWVN